MKGILISGNYWLNFDDRNFHYKHLIHKNKINLIMILPETISFH